MKRVALVFAVVLAAMATEARWCWKCDVWSNPGAKHCFNCGTELKLETVEEQYESLLRQALPTIIAKQEKSVAGLPLKAEQAIAEKMGRFRKLGAARQTNECEQARAALAMMKSSPDELRKVVARAEASSMAMHGRNVFVGIVMANTERESAGIGAVWPKADGKQAAYKDDIAGKRFANATDYFRELLDMARFGKADWTPYVAGLDPKFVFDEATGKAKWVIAKGVEDSQEDIVPVMASANVDPTSLVTAAGTHDGSKLEGKLRFTGDYAIIIRKGGAAQVIKPAIAGLSTVYGRQTFDLPKGFGYLAP